MNLIPHSSCLQYLWYSQSELWWKQPSVDNDIINSYFRLHSFNSNRKKHLATKLYWRWLTRKHMYEYPHFLFLIGNWYYEKNCFERNNLFQQILIRSLQFPVRLVILCTGPLMYIAASSRIPMGCHWCKNVNI
jgi:hypothetical protein